MSPLYGPKAEHAKALSTLIARRAAGELTHDGMLEEMLRLDALFPNCGWMEAAIGLQKMHLEDELASARMRARRGEMT